MFMLSACASSDTIGTSESFVQGASADGLAIMGLKSSKWYGWDYSVICRRFDPATKELVGDADGTIVLRRSAFEVFTPDGLSTKKYVVFRAKPGSYAPHSTITEASNFEFNRVYRPGTIAFTIGRAH